MRKWEAADGHRLARGLILLGFAGLIAWLTISGDVKLYMTPKMTLYLELAGAVLVLLAGVHLYVLAISLKRPAVAAACSCGYDHEHGGHAQAAHSVPRSMGMNALIYGMFLLPLLLGGLLPNQALAGSLAANRGMNLGGVSASAADAAPADLIELDGAADPAVRSLFRTIPANRDYAKLGILLYQQDLIEMKDEWFIEKLTAMNTFANNFQGKQIRITGFVYREDGLPEGQFIVGRMAMTHCIADISPYGIIIDTPDAASYANDAWVTVTGTIDTTTFHGMNVIKIDAGSIESAKPSSAPYIYPDWDFASKI